MSYPRWMREGVRKCDNCGRMKNLYRWVTNDGYQRVSCEECAISCGWSASTVPSPDDGRDQNARPARVSPEPTRPIARFSADDQDAFGKWVMRGIAIGIGLLIVQIPLALIAMAWMNHQLSKLGF